MIANDEQLEIVREQVKRLETALGSLAKTVRPKSESQHRVLAEGYVPRNHWPRTSGLAFALK